MAPEKVSSVVMSSIFPPGWRMRASSLRPCARIGEVLQHPAAHDGVEIGVRVRQARQSAARIVDAIGLGTAAARLSMRCDRSKA